MASEFSVQRSAREYSKICTRKLLVASIAKKLRVQVKFGGVKKKQFELLFPTITRKWGVPVRFRPPGGISRILHFSMEKEKFPVFE